MTRHTMAQFEKATSVLAQNGFFGYFGPGYTTSMAVDDFMRRYPRGKGIKAFDERRLNIYAACRIWKIERSRTKNYKELPDVS